MSQVGRSLQLRGEKTASSARCSRSIELLNLHKLFDSDLKFATVGVMADCLANRGRLDLNVQPQ